MELSSPNLAGTFLHDPVHIWNIDMISTQPNETNHCQFQLKARAVTSWRHGGELSLFCWWSPRGSPRLDLSSDNKSSCNRMPFNSLRYDKSLFLLLFGGWLEFRKCMRGKIYLQILEVAQFPPHEPCITYLQMKSSRNLVGLLGYDFGKIHLNYLPFPPLNQGVSP